MIQETELEPRLLDPAELDAVSGGLIHEEIHQSTAQQASGLAGQLILSWRRAQIAPRGIEP